MKSTSIGWVVFVCLVVCGAWGQAGVGVPAMNDYDGDGASDLAVFDTAGGYWYVHDIAADILVWKNQWGWSTAKPVPGDYNGDGAWDLAVFDTAGGNWYIKEFTQQIQ